MRVLVVSSMFPNRQLPNLGIWVKEQTDLLSKHNPVSVVSPTPYVPNTRLFRKSRWFIHLQSYTEIPEREKICNTTVFHPRFFALRISDRSRLNIFGVASLIQVLLYLFSIVIFLIRNRDHIRKTEIIHAYGIIPDGFCAVILSKFVKKPVVLTILGGELYNNIQKLFLRGIMSYTLGKSSHIICVSEMLKDTALGVRGRINDRISVIPNGVNTTLFRPLPLKKIRRKLGLPLDKKIILSVGNLSPLKGHKYLIEATRLVLKKRQDITIVIVGSGVKEGKLKQLAVRLGLAETIIFVGQKKHEEVPAWMNTCNLFVLPSIKESFGVVIIEAMACGKPVVASRVGGVPEIISRDDLGILVEPANPESLSKAILSALERKWLAELIRDYSRQYSWINISKRIQEVYSTVINSTTHLHSENET